MYNAVCCLFSFVLPKLTKRLGLKMTHSLCLGAGAMGLSSLLLIHNQYVLLLPHGWHWDCLGEYVVPSLTPCSLVPCPQKKAVCIWGIFNFFIVLPEIVAALGLGWMMSHIFADNRLAAVVLGGGFMLIAALLTQRVQAHLETPDDETCEDGIEKSQTFEHLASTH